ncbi:MAG: DNA repair protein RadC [Cytophagaceae bacterium]|jgi:DNA repair protein RadC|nr:DNA repair protein RadC [Cytophagaceae bacterium]
METTTTSGGIPSWAEDDRPREKLILKGGKALSDAELIAILLGSGSKELSAVDLAKVLLKDNDQNIHELARKSIEELCKYKGIGEAKAVTILAALELSRRRSEQEQVSRPQIKFSEHVYQLMRGELMDLPYEEFWILLLNRSNHVLKKIKISSGGVTGTVVDSKLIFKYALEHLACSIILVHNHPSGQCRPSPEDIQLTQKLSKAGALLDIPILDHVIIAQLKWYSFGDEGQI